MAVTYGFFNSQDGDRKYTAEQLSAIFDGIITDGVIAGVGKTLFTYPYTGMTVFVGSGRAWFDNTWTLNDNDLFLTVENAHAVLKRIDAVVLCVDKHASVRANSIFIKKGTSGANPNKPAMSNSSEYKEYPLAWIMVNPGATSITEADIEIQVGRDPVPFCTSVLQSTDIEALFNQWDGQFTTWFNNLKVQLSGDIVTNIQNQLDQLDSKTDDNFQLTLQSGFRNYRIEFITESCDFVFPNNILGNLVTVTCIGGGGGGGGSAGKFGGGGGGSGRITQNTFIINPEETYYITIGDGGNGGAGSPTNNDVATNKGTNGGNGGSTWFENDLGSLLNATGGSGGLGGNGYTKKGGNGGIGSAGGGGGSADSSGTPGKGGKGLLFGGGGGGSWYNGSDFPSGGIGGAYGGNGGGPTANSTKGIKKDPKIMERVLYGPCRLHLDYNGTGITNVSINEYINNVVELDSIFLGSENTFDGSGGIYSSGGVSGINAPASSASKYSYSGTGGGGGYFANGGDSNAGTSNKPYGGGGGGGYFANGGFGKYGAFSGGGGGAGGFYLPTKSRNDGVQHLASSASEYGAGYAAGGAGGSTKYSEQNSSGLNGVQGLVILEYFLNE